MGLLDNILFTGIFIYGVYFFINNCKKILRNIHLGKDIERGDNQPQRWRNMIMLALGQTKMVKRPLSGILHIIVYVGFILINIELLEIVVDGVFGTHRALSFLGSFYQFVIASFEILAFLVFVAVTVFWFRRNIGNIKRFLSNDLKGWPKTDANNILYFEMVLMTLFLTMNAADSHLYLNNFGHYTVSFYNPISQFIQPIFNNFDLGVVMIIERVSWWLHIVGILVFLNYLYFSKHLHILLAFPNTYYADLNAKGRFDNLESVTKEVKLMLDPNMAFAPSTESEIPAKFGASDVFDLNKIQLLNAYTCTECGRCTSSCPANQTGKKLSPRKIMMDTRDRLEEVGRNIDQNKGVFVNDNKSLLDNYISREELWACTTCNACVEECPVAISPLSIILDMRRYLVMEQSAAPIELNNMMTNIENNGAPWPYNQMDRLNWKNESI